MAALLHSPELQFCDADGHPYAAGTLETYVVSTTTPKTTWQDAEEVVANTNPIVLDAAGRCILYGDGLYRLILKDADGNLVWDQPSSTLISDAMAPVVIAPTLADARYAMGIDDAIQVETDRALAAEAAEEAAREAADIALQAAIDAEVARALAAEAALQAEIDAIPPPAAASNVQGGTILTGADGHVRLTFPVAFTTECTSFQVTQLGSGFISITAIALADRFGADVWVTSAGSPIPKPAADFYWLALGD